MGGYFFNLSSCCGGWGCSGPTRTALGCMSVIVEHSTPEDETAGLYRTPTVLSSEGDNIQASYSNVFAFGLWVVSI